MKPDLRTLPGVGPATEAGLQALGISSPAQLRGQDPEELYRRSCALQWTELDRCVLYVYRCAVYAAETEHPEPEKCKWWNWKDQRAEG